MRSDHDTHMCCEGRLKLSCSTVVDRSALGIGGTVGLVLSLAAEEMRLNIEATHSSLS